jgi:hypothetical protein
MTEPEFSRPATLDDLKLLLRSLQNHGADYLSVGGYALAAHGYQRATTDIDLQGLLLTKKTLREKDQLDCQIIERALAVLREQGAGLM